MDPKTSLAVSMYLLGVYHSLLLPSLGNASRASKSLLILLPSSPTALHCLHRLFAEMHWSSHCYSIASTQDYCCLRRRSFPSCPRRQCTCPTCRNCQSDMKRWQ